MRSNTSTRVTLASMVAVTIGFAVLAWNRRWISDDGLIYVRVIHNIVEGNGPVFNAFERAEANTSALWPWSLALIGWVTGCDLARLAVWAGMAASVAGVALAMDATRRWHRARGSQAMLVPGSVVIVLGVFPFWDFASSGLESSLAILWIAIGWRLLVTLLPGASLRRQLATAIGFGLGPLIRPDLGVASLVLFVAGWQLLRPTRRRALALVGAGIALPLAYEVFRAGYYGALVPLPALAKSASRAEWGRGLDYLINFIKPHWLWLPFGVFVALFVQVIRKQTITARDRVLIAAPLISATLTAIYVLRVGGDFMHGRLWLPAAFMMMLPGLLLPLRRFTAPAVIALACWAVLCGAWLRRDRNAMLSEKVNDERRGYTRWTKSRNPTDASVYIKALGPVPGLVADAVRAARGAMLVEGGGSYAIDPKLGAKVVFLPGRLGAGGMVTPLDGIVSDTLGLAHPIGARITRTNLDEAAGHEKTLPRPWPLAEFGDPARDHKQTDLTPAVQIRAARHAMTCGELKELLDSVRAPLTAARFWDNLVGAVRRTRIVIPADPVDAEWQFCGRASASIRARSSSSHSDSGWSIWNAVDGVPTVPGESMGFSSAVGPEQDREEWITLELPIPRSISSVVLHPRTDPGMVGAGFPVAFRIQIWDGARWVDRAERRGQPAPDAPVIVSWSPADTTDQVRLIATRLGAVSHGSYMLQLAELEVR